MTYFFGNSNDKIEKFISDIYFWYLFHHDGYFFIADMALFRFECTFSAHARQDSSSFNWIWVARIIFFNHSILLVVLLLVSTLKIRLLIVWISSFDMRYFSYEVFRVSMATCWWVAKSDLSALTLSAYRSYEVQLRKEYKNLIDCFVSPSSWIFPCALPNLFLESPFLI